MVDKDLAKNVVNEAFTIDPVVVTNLFVNYTVKSPFAQTKRAKLQFGVNNLMDSHSITGIAGVTNGSTSANPNCPDVPV